MAAGDPGPRPDRPSDPTAPGPAGPARGDDGSEEASRSSSAWSYPSSPGRRISSWPSTIRTIGRMVGTSVTPRAHANTAAVERWAARRGEGVHGRRQQFDLARAEPVERVAGPDPDGGDGLAVIVARHLPGGRGGHEEAGVVPPRRKLRRDPVAHVVHGVDSQDQALRPAHVQQSRRPVVDGQPVRLEALRHRRVVVSSRSGPRRRPRGRASRTPASSKHSRRAATQRARPPESTPRIRLASASDRPSHSSSAGRPGRRGRPSPPGRRRRRPRTRWPGCGAACTPRCRPGPRSIDAVPDQHHGGGIADGNGHGRHATPGASRHPPAGLGPGNDVAARAPPPSGRRPAR